MEEVTAWFMARLKWFILLGIVSVALMIGMVVLFILAALAVANNHWKPCDQPLKYYLLAGILWSQVPPALTAMLARCMQVEEEDGLSRCLLVGNLHDQRSEDLPKDKC